jgi:hypothetical protein
VAKRARIGKLRGNSIPLLAKVLLAASRLNSMIKTIIGMIMNMRLRTEFCDMIIPPLFISSLEIFSVGLVECNGKFSCFQYTHQQQRGQQDLKISHVIN